MTSQLGVVDPEPIVTAIHVSKRFRRHTSRATSLKERAIKSTATKVEDFIALADVSIDIHPGETVGLIGTNGSGKSTLLKILSGILRQSSGEVQVKGRIASLLELGAGFNGELTGRENIFLNAALLGLSRRETEESMESIIDFSELAAFIDEPVKHYSSGMYVRLGFAVAVHVDPDVLLIDEVLAVGDEAFQRKCMNRIRNFQDAGRTILFVSHSLEQVEQLCTRAVVLNRGRLVDDAAPSAATKTLRKIMGTDQPVLPTTVTPDDGFTFGDIVVSTGSVLAGVSEIGPDDPLVVTAQMTLNHHWAHLVDRVEVVLMGDHDWPLWVMSASGVQLPNQAGRWSVRSSACRGTHGFGPPPGWAVQVTDATGRPLAHTQTKYLTEIRSDHGPGLLDVDFDVSVSVQPSRFVPAPRTRLPPTRTEHLPCRQHPR